MSRVRRRSVSPTGMDNGQDTETYYQPQNGHNHHQSVSEVHQSRSSINHQDVLMAHESPYSKDVHADHMMTEDNGSAHVVNGTSSKYSLLQFAAQHFRHE